MNELVDPLVPPDVDLRDFGFMPLDVLRLRDSDLATEATGDEFKAAVLLWCAAWHQQPAGSVPNREAWLARHSGAGDQWPAVRDMALRGFVECSDGRLYHPVIAEKALDAWKSKQAQRERTRAATEAREQRRREALAARDDQRDVVRDVQRDEERESERHVHQGIGTGTVKGQGQGQGDPIERAPTAVGRRPSRKCPVDFAVTDELVQWAAENAPGVDLERETAKFRDHTFSNARGDWPATWRNWIRKADEGKRPQPRAADRTDRQLQTAALMTGAARATPPARPVQEVIDADTGRLLA